MREALGHRATWAGLMYDEARKKGIDLEEVGRAAVSKTGYLHGAKINTNKPAETVETFKNTFID